MSVMSVRLADDVTQQLEDLAKAVGRTKSFLIGQAIQAYLEQEAWQIQEVKRGLAEADAGDFVPDAEMDAFFAKYGA